MNYKQVVFIILLLAGGVLTGAAILGIDPRGAAPAQESAATGEEYERGPHRGRMLRDQDFAIEITIYETGVPPEFRVYAFKNGKLLPPSEVSLAIELSRLGGKINRFGFRPQADFLRGDGEVVEPHSFDVRVTATHAGRTSEWGYESYEGRTQIDPQAAAEAGIEVESAGPGTIREIASLTGSITLNADKMARVRARFPGVVRAVHKGLGAQVNAGEPLATIESNESLRSYTVTAPISGLVLSRATNVGDVAGDGVLFEIADLSSVWAEMHVFGRDRKSIRAGQPIEIKSLDGELTTSGKIGVVLPTANPASQTVAIRVVLDNGEGQWRPGMFVRGAVTVAERQVPLAVKTSGLQRFRDFDVVFAQVDDTYEIRMLELGLSDGTWVEVTGGIDEGEIYVAENSFLIKADIEKSGASHDH